MARLKVALEGRDQFADKVPPNGVDGPPPALEGRRARRRSAEGEPDNLVVPGALGGPRMRRATALCSLVARIIGGGAFPPPRPPAAVTRPNFLVFVADDMSWDDCGAYGNPAVPNIDGSPARGCGSTARSSRPVRAARAASILDGPVPARDRAKTSTSRCRRGAPRDAVAARHEDTSPPPRASGTSGRTRAAGRRGARQAAGPGQGIPVARRAPGPPKGQAVLPLARAAIDPPPVRPERAPATTRPTCACRPTSRTSPRCGRTSPGTTTRSPGWTTSSAKCWPNSTPRKLAADGRDVHLRQRPPVSAAQDHALRRRHPHAADPPLPGQGEGGVGLRERRQHGRHRAHGARTGRRRRAGHAAARAGASRSCWTIAAAARAFANTTGTITRRTSGVQSGRSYIRNWLPRRGRPGRRGGLPDVPGDARIARRGQTPRTPAPRLSCRRGRRRNFTTWMPTPTRCTTLALRPEHATTLAEMGGRLDEVARQNRRHARSCETDARPV